MKRRTIPIPPPLLRASREQRRVYRVADQLERRGRALIAAADKIREELDRERGSDLPPRLDERTTFYWAPKRRRRNR